MVRKINPKIEQKQLPYKLYYFVCEDAKSMRYYLQGLKRKYDGKRIVIKTEKAKSGNDAKSVYKSAIEKRKEISKRKANYPNGYEIIACFDKDNNDIIDIKSIFSKNQRLYNIKVIYNNPCYEYWLLLHITRTTKIFTNSRQCCHETMLKINDYYHQNFEDVDELKKADNIFEIMGSDLPKAIQNAKFLNFNDDCIDETYTNAHVVFEEIVNTAN